MKRMGFTLIELIVVMAIISILVLLGVPKYKQYTEEAQLTRIKVNIKEIEKASQKYYMTYNDWPRLNDEHLTSVELESYSSKILDLTGEEFTLDANGKYYEIDYTSLKKYVTIPKDKGNYILQNPVGDVLYLKDITQEGKENLSNIGKENIVEEPQGIKKVLYTEVQIADFLNQGYVIVQSPEDLNNVRNNLTGKYIQVCDIDIASYVNWVPIGTFKGIYNGGGYEIRNLTINTPTADYVGLFGKVYGGIISNIGLTNVKVAGNSYVGGLVGDNSGSSTISNSYSIGTVTGVNTVGGLVAYNYKSSISNSYFTGSVTGSQDSTGGLVGHNYYSGTIDNSYSTGTVTGVNRVGGLVGINNGSKIRNTYFKGNVSGSGNTVGGLVGDNRGSSTISTSYFTGTVTGSGMYVGNLVGSNNNSTVSNSYWDIEISGMTTSAGGTGKTTLDMYKQSTYVGWDFINVWKINEGVSYPILQWQN